MSETVMDKLADAVHDVRVAAAIGHVLVAAVDDRSGSPVLVNEALVAAARGLYPLAQEAAALAPNVESEGAWLNMERIVDILRDDYGIVADIDQTGGGCATIFAGRKIDGPEGKVWAAVAGPGSWPGGWLSGQGAPVVHTDELCVGRDDQGRAQPWHAAGFADVTEADAARYIAARCSTDPLLVWAVVYPAGQEVLVHDPRRREAKPAYTRVAGRPVLPAGHDVENDVVVYAFAEDAERAAAMLNGELRDGEWGPWTIEPVQVPL